MHNFQSPYTNQAPFYYYIYPIQEQQPPQNMFWSFVIPDYNTVPHQNPVNQQIQQPEACQHQEVRNLNLPHNQNSSGVKKNQKNINADRQRNMISNSIKVFRKFVKDSIKAGRPYIDTIIQQNGLVYSEQKFLSEFQKFIPENKNYFGSKYLKKMTTRKNEYTPFQKVFRILLNFYYRKGIFPSILTSRKILKKAKLVQLNAARTIMLQCFQAK